MIVKDKDQDSIQHQHIHPEIPYRATAEASRLIALAQRSAESAVSRIVAVAQLDSRNWTICEEVITLKFLEAFAEAGCLVYQKPIPEKTDAICGFLDEECDFLKLAESHPLGVFTAELSEEMRDFFHCGLSYALAKNRIVKIETVFNRGSRQWISACVEEGG